MLHLYMVREELQRSYACGSWQSEEGSVKARRKEGKQRCKQPKAKKRIRYRGSLNGDKGIQETGSLTGLCCSSAVPTPRRSVNTG